MTKEKKYLCKKTKTLAFEMIREWGWFFRIFIFQRDIFYQVANTFYLLYLQTSKNPVLRVQVLRGCPRIESGKKLKMKNEKLKRCPSDMF
jgi:hypothetical protein